MRISSKEASAISKLGLEIFGSTAKLQLFGSRTDNNKRGGDIDLLIVVPQNQVQHARKQKYIFLDKLQGEIGEQRIDILITTESHLSSDPFLQTLEAIELT